MIKNAKAQRRKEAGEWKMRFLTKLLEPPLRSTEHWEAQGYLKVFTDAYRVARLSAIKETGLDRKVFPMDCPWTVKECMEDAGLPVLDSPKKKPKKNLGKKKS
jgi:hypothetical protein